MASTEGFRTRNPIELSKYDMASSGKGEAHSSCLDGQDGNAAGRIILELVDKLLPLVCGQLAVDADVVCALLVAGTLDGIKKVLVVGEHKELVDL